MSFTLWVNLYHFLSTVYIVCQTLKFSASFKHCPSTYYTVYKPLVLTANLYIYLLLYMSTFTIACQPLALYVNLLHSPLIYWTVCKPLALPINLLNCLSTWSTICQLLHCLTTLSTIGYPSAFSTWSTIGYPSAFSVNLVHSLSTSGTACQSVTLSLNIEYRLSIS